MPGGDTTNRRGPYELNLFEPGTYLIFPKYYGWPDEEMMSLYGKHVRWTPDEEVTVNFELPEHVTRSVRVVDVKGNPIEKAEVGRFTRLSTGASSMPQLLAP